MSFYVCFSYNNFLKPLQKVNFRFIATDDVDRRTVFPSIYMFVTRLRCAKTGEIFGDF